MAQAQLYDYWRSSASYRIRIALNLAGISYQSSPIDLVAGAQNLPDYRSINPQGLVPVLEIDGKRLAQSLATIEYLHDAGHLVCLPGIRMEKYRVRRLSHIIAMDIHPVCNLSVSQYATRKSDGMIALTDWMHQFIPRGLAAFEELLADEATGRFCHGNTITMADICLVPQLYNAERWDISLDPYPEIRRIAADLESLDAFRAAHPDNCRKGA